MRHDVRSGARRIWHQCFDTLYEARKHFYPVDVYLLDVTLLAETTLGAACERDWPAPRRPTCWARPGCCDTICAEQPPTWSSLLAAIDAGTACVLGGEQEERELPLLPLETALAHRWPRACSEYETLLGRRPQVYARRRAGLWPALPQLLVKLGYQGALHFTLDDGRFPLGPQSKTRWEGLDTSMIDVLAPRALRRGQARDVSGPVAQDGRLDGQRPRGHAWPSPIGPARPAPGTTTCGASPQLSPVLGKFMLLDDYFSHTDMPGRLSKFEPTNIARRI